MKKILLITTSFEDNLRTPDIQHNSHYPLGVAYLHSFLESAGNSVETLFLNDYKYEDCFDIACKMLINFDPDVVGFQILTANRVTSFNLIEYIHNTYPTMKIIIGGIHTTAMYKQILERYPYVVAVLGEGEITLLDIVNDKRPELIDGVAFNHNGQIIKTKDRQLIDDLDKLPFPKHETFFVNGRSIGSMLTSRGCPFSCTFCCLFSITNRKVRYRSAKNVVDEIEYLVDKYPDMANIWLHDDSFFLNNDRVIEICDEIIKRDIKIGFICSGRMKPVSLKMVEKLEKAGFHHVLFGLESGAAAILKFCKKGITKEDAINAFRLFAKSSIRVTAFLIVGLPGETAATVKETIELVQTLQKIKYTLYEDIGILFVYPGTEVYEFAKSKGFIDDNYWLTDQCIPLYAVEHSKEKLYEFKEMILNHIALNRIFTVEGFKAQKGLLPSIFTDRYMRKNFVRLLLRKILSIVISDEKINKIKIALGLDRPTRKARIAFIKKLLLKSK